MKQTIVLNQSTEDLKVEGIKVNGTSLKQFRADLVKKGFTFVNVVYQAGKYVVTFLTYSVKEIVLADSGLIKGSKLIRTELKRLNRDSKLKFNTLGYSF